MIPSSSPFNSSPLIRSLSRTRSDVSRQAFLRLNPTISQQDIVLIHSHPSTNIATPFRGFSAKCQSDLAAADSRPKPNLPSLQTELRQWEATARFRQIRHVGATIWLSVDLLKLLLPMQLRQLLDNVVHRKALLTAGYPWLTGCFYFSPQTVWLSSKPPVPPSAD